ncbi:DUF1816 domain-containing protein [Aerosakkonemataceae cyanobacterium BLCC-F50]|uniref:DUF1816 domain-containing protein n=1 Tax=Floridaenema flaviceps BLCC-F50 TaxID=3153642 RepID=A0ABV4XNF0_9CYAN
MSWWLEIVTKNPSCIYYFGPFDSLREAELEKGGYIEDLRQEQAEIIDTRIKFLNPLQLTIDLDEPEREREMKVPA